MLERASASVGRPGGRAVGFPPAVMFEWLYIILHSLPACLVERLCPIHPLSSCVSPREQYPSMLNFPNQAEQYVLVFQQKQVT